VRSSTTMTSAPGSYRRWAGPQSARRDRTVRPCYEGRGDSPWTRGCIASFSTAMSAAPCPPMTVPY